MNQPERIWLKHRVPQAFDQIQSYLHQDYDIVHGSLENALDAYVRGIRKADREPLGTFLDLVLKGDYSGGELKNLWFNPGGVEPRHGKDVRAILNAIRMKLPESRES